MYSALGVHTLSITVPESHVAGVYTVCALPFLTAPLRKSHHHILQVSVMAYHSQRASTVFRTIASPADLISAKQW